MSTFRKLPFALDPSVPKTLGKLGWWEFDSLSNPTPGPIQAATSFWSLGFDNPLLGDQVGSHDLTVSNVVNRFETHVSMIQTLNYGLKTDIDDSHDLTFCAVVRKVTNSAFRIIWGTINAASGGSPRGQGISFTTGGGVRTYVEGGSGTVAVTATDATWGDGTWGFVAYSIDSSAGTSKAYIVHESATVAASGTFTGGVLSTRKQGIGQLYHNTGLSNAELHIAEAMYFDSPLTQSQIEGIYQIEKLRMAKRGINLH